MIASNMEVIANELWNELYIFVASATRALKKLLRQCRRSSWFPLLAVAGSALLGIVAIKVIALLGAAFDISFLRDVGNNVGPGGAAGGAGAGAGGGAAGGGSGGGGSGGSGGGPGGPPDGKDPWWKDHIPHTIPIGGGVGLNVFTGRIEGPGGISIGAAPGSDPAGPIIDVNIPPPPPVPDLGIPPLHTPSGNISVSINQQNVPLTGAGSTTPTGRQILNANMSSDGTYNNIGN
jgi:hypothetical protein